MAVRLLSPNRRRIVNLDSMSARGIMQLRGQGWKDYDGPARVTTDDQPALSGWIIPGTDPRLDAVRTARTGSRDLG